MPIGQRSRFGPRAVLCTTRASHRACAALCCAHSQRFAHVHPPRPFPQLSMCLSPAACSVLTVRLCLRYPFFCGWSRGSAFGQLCTQSCHTRLGAFAIFGGIETPPHGLMGPLNRSLYHEWARMQPRLRHELRTLSHGREEGELLAARRPLAHALCFASRRAALALVHRPNAREPRRSE